MEEHLQKEEKAFREVLNGGGKKRKAVEGRNTGRGSPDRE
jgi:hypothetical protein